MTDRTRVWTLTSRVLFVVFLVVAGPSVLGWTSSVLIPFEALAFTVAVWAISPRRSWWGPGPAAMMRDPAFKDWRRAETRFTVTAFVVVGVGLVMMSVLIGRIHL